MRNKWLPDDALSGIPVIVVEANRDDRAVLTALLAMYGADVSAVRSAREAAAALRSSPAVVVCDPGASPEDGLSLLRQAAACFVQDGRRRRVLALSDSFAPRDSAQVLALGFDGFLAKPVDVQVLCAMVADLARGGRPEVA